MYSRETELKYTYLLFDLLILNLSLLTMGWIIEVDHHLLVIYFYHGNLSWIISFFLFAKRNLYLRDGFVNRVRRITKRTLVFLVILLVWAALVLPRQYSRTFLLEYTLLFYFGKLLFYRILYSFLKFKRRKGLNTVRAVIIGKNETTLLLKNILQNNPMLGYQFLGFLETQPENNPGVLGESDQLPELIKKHTIQIVFASISLFERQHDAKEILKICNQNGVRLRFIPENQRWFRSRINMETVGSLALINPQEIPLDNLEARIWKRLFDILFSTAMMMLVFSWLFPILALMIKLSSKGPVFFVQQRTGINNNTFTCLKFRSMKINGDSDTLQATVNDQRITRIGRFLRKSNMDELPQFLNVLMGQMSVVGPRPHMLKHTEQYATLIDHYLIRHYVKPGITGWAQVNGYRGETDELWKMEKRVQYDMEYIENWNFGWDIAIIWETIFGKRSYRNAF